MIEVGRGMLPMDSIGIGLEQSVAGHGLWASAERSIFA